MVLVNKGMSILKYDITQTIHLLQKLLLKAMQSHMQLTITENTQRLPLL